MPIRSGRIEDLLFDGETVSETVDLSSGQVVVTSHRVLAFTPGTSGANFQQADLPNVEGVGTGARTKAGLLERAIKTGVVGGVLVGTGLVVDFESVVGDVDLGGGEAAGQVGLGGVLGPVRTFLGLVRDLDQYMQIFGALALALAVVLFGAYWYLREPTLVIRVAGGDDVHVPRADGDADALNRLERAIAPGPADGHGTDGAAGDPLAES